MTIQLHCDSSRSPILHLPDSGGRYGQCFSIKLAGRRLICDDGCPVARRLLSCRLKSPRDMALIGFEASFFAKQAQFDGNIAVVPFEV